MIRASNDQLGLTGIWFEVPPEVERPKSALEFDRKGGVAIDMMMQQQAGYWREVEAAKASRLGKQNRSSKQRRTKA